MRWLPPPSPSGTCLVTGASSGIGAATARELATRGHGVTLVARREERLRALAEELAAVSPSAHFVACDLASSAERAALVEEVEALGLRVDVLVNSAGLGSYGPFVELDPKRELEQVRVMSEAVVDLCRAFAPSMAAERSGADLDRLFQPR